MKIGIIVFIRNLLIALSGIIIVSRSVKFLSEQESALIVLLMIIVNAQNALYEGLFITHTMAYNEQIAKKILRKQLKVLIIIPVFFLFITYCYSKFILHVNLNILDLILIFIVLIFNILSIGIVNIFCSNENYLYSFLFDILFIIISITIIIIYPFKYTIIFILFFRISGTTLASILFYLKEKSTSVNLYSSHSLYSINFFSGTFLAFIRDSLFPLLIGWLVGPTVLVSLRVFNTCYSAPGLIASAMNKIIIRYAHNVGGFLQIQRLYLFSLYLLSISYFIFWFFGGEYLFTFLFGNDKGIDINIFILSLSLFCLFWPLGQLSISKIIYYGISKLFIYISIVWTLISIISLLLLINYSFSFYMVFFSTSQLINIFILIYVKHYLIKSNRS